MVMNYLKIGSIYNSAIGCLTIVNDGCAIKEIIFGDKREDCDVKQEDSLNQKAMNQLEEYFEGKRKTFDLVIEPEGTEFQRRDWKALCTIPYGETRSYKQIAEQIGCPKGSRAVGMANNKNPIPIIIPCHRVVGSNGMLVGYAGGMDIKTFLLKLEKGYDRR